MTKTTYKVGNKVRILDAKKIKNAVKDGFKSGEVYPVTRIYDDGRPVIEHETDFLAFFQDELKYIEKVEESDAKMTQFKVGDKVRVINANASKHSNGDEGVVVSITPIWGVVFIDVDVNGVQQGHYAKDIELVSPKPTKNQRLTMLEQKVEAMQAEIDALKATQKSADIAKIVDGIAKMVAKEKKLTANEQASANKKRKAIIDEAKAFVEDVQKRDYRVRSTPAITSFQKSVFFGQTDELVFHVNAEKRTVVAIIRTIRGKHVVHKGIAKCNPSDVFNADIGKAIALGRALGLDVERFEKAVQPNEVVVGTVVIHVEDKDVYTIEGIYEGNHYDMRHTDGEYFEKFRMMNSIDTFYDIVNDTEAQY